MTERQICFQRDKYVDSGTNCWQWDKFVDSGTNWFKYTHRLCLLNGTGGLVLAGFLAWATCPFCIRFSSRNWDIISKLLKNSEPTSMKIVSSSALVYARWPLTAIRINCSVDTATCACIFIGVGIHSARVPRAPHIESWAISLPPKSLRSVSNFTCTKQFETFRLHLPHYRKRSQHHILCGKIS